VSITLRYAARSDVGLVRGNNQDSAFAGSNLLVVCDGMGGAAGGDVASSVVVAHLAQLDDEAHGPDDIVRELKSAVGEAHAEMLDRVKAEPALAGLGTTVTAILRAENKLAMAHVGDSRAYLLRDGELTQVTTDHTFVQHLVNTGRISQEEAEQHPQRSVLLRVLGDFDPEIPLDISMREAHPGERWLLCSDGLSGVVGRDTLLETLRDTTDVGRCADQLIQLALKAGGPDNITCIVADVIDLDQLPDGALPGAAAQIVGAAAVERNRPSSAGDGPAARAAGLGRSGSNQAPATQPEDELEAADRPVRKRRLRIGLIALGVILVVLTTASTAGYRWTQRQFYVGVADGKVAIYRGIPQSIGPLALSSVYQGSDLNLVDLPGFMQARLDNVIQTAGLTDARTRVAAIAADLRAPTSASASPSASASASPSPSPTATPGPTATPSAPGATATVSP
jgi:serine/threonine protein phosphatase PrpC